MPPHTWPFEDLVPELRAWADGDDGIEAAVNLLAAHRTWLTRHDFQAACVHTTAGHLVEDFGLPRAWLDFEAAATIADRGTLPASDSERQILAIAAELAGYPTSRPLGDLLRGLDTTNTARVLTAITHATGHAAGGEVP